jgi:hypothetical protein
MRCIVKERVQKNVGRVIRRESDRTGAEFEKEGEVKRVGGGNAEQSEDEGSTDVWVGQVEQATKGESKNLIDGQILARWEGDKF